MKCDEKSFVQNLAEQAEEAAGQNNLKELYDITEKLADSRRSVEQPVKNKLVISV